MRTAGSSASGPTRGLTDPDTVKCSLLPQSSTRERDDRSGTSFGRLECGAMKDEFFPVRLRVRYAETDQMGVVHHSVYPIWFEAARTELARARGVPYSDWERDGTYLMLSDLACRYRHPAVYDEEVIVGVRVAAVASRRVVFAYRVTRGDGTVLAEGETRHLVVSRASGRPTALPEHLREALARGARS
jgi:acyl-CoA thioester hydrolase